MNSFSPYVVPDLSDKSHIRFNVMTDGKKPPEPPKTSRGAKFKCICCGESTNEGYIKQEGLANRMGARLMAIVVEGKNGRLYVSPSDEQERVANMFKPDDCPNQTLPNDPRNIWCVNYGLDTYLAWGEFGSWGLDMTTARGLELFLPEWMECVKRDFNHPAIIGWCPLKGTVIFRG